MCIIFVVLKRIITSLQLYLIFIFRDKGFHFMAVTFMEKMIFLNSYQKCVFFLKYCAMQAYSYFIPNIMYCHFLFSVLGYIHCGVLYVYIREIGI